MAVEGSTSRPAVTTLYTSRQTVSTAKVVQAGNRSQRRQLTSLPRLASKAPSCRSQRLMWALKRLQALL
eukprot:1147863-Amphidinium_carterae.2